MPRMVCMDCGAVAYEASSLHAMLVKMMPHYLDTHHDVISGHTEEPRETWMARFTAAYEHAASKGTPVSESPV